MKLFLENIKHFKILFLNFQAVSSLIAVGTSHGLVLVFGKYNRWLDGQNVDCTIYFPNHDDLLNIMTN